MKQNNREKRGGNHAPLLLPPRSRSRPLNCTLGTTTVSIKTLTITRFNIMILCTKVYSMFVQRKVCYSALFTNLVGWHAGAVSFPPRNIILAQLACPLGYVMFCLHSGRTNLSLYKHWVYFATPTIG
jgi:hypothetical protein